MIRGPAPKRTNDQRSRAAESTALPGDGMRRLSKVALVLGGIGAGLALVTWLARPRRRTPPQSLAPTEEFVWAGGVRTHVTRHGSTGPIVVLLHGLRGWYQTWRHVAPELALRARVVLIDMKGFGLSTLPLRGE